MFNNKQEGKICSICRRAGHFTSECPERTDPPVVNAITSNKLEREVWIINVTCNGIEYKAIIDCGSEINVCSAPAAKHSVLPFGRNFRHATFKAHGINGQFSVFGMCTFPVTVNGVQIEIDDVNITDLAGPYLLPGRPFMIQFDLHLQSRDRVCTLNDVPECGVINMVRGMMVPPQQCRTSNKSSQQNGGIEYVPQVNMISTTPITERPKRWQSD